MNTTLPARRLAAAFSVAALLLSGAACSTSGDDDAAPPTTAASSTTGGDDETTTTEGDDETTTTTDGGDSGDSDFDDLLPGLDALPAGYEEVPSDDDESSDDDDFGPELEEACPDADLIREFSEQDPITEGQAKRTFQTEYGQEIEVIIRHGSDREVPLDDLVKAYNGCDPLDTVDDGTPMTADFFAETIDLGESFHMQLDIVIDFGDTPLEMTLHGFMFRRDGISVQVSAQSGIDETDFSSKPAHDDEAYEIAADIYEAIGSR